MDKFSDLRERESLVQYKIVDCEEGSSKKHLWETSFDGQGISIQQRNQFKQDLGHNTPLDEISVMPKNSISWITDPTR